MDEGHQGLADSSVAGKPRLIRGGITQELAQNFRGIVLFDINRNSALLGAALSNPKGKHWCLRKRFAYGKLTPFENRVESGIIGSAEILTRGVSCHHAEIWPKTPHPGKEEQGRKGGQQCDLRAKWQ